MFSGTKNHSNFDSFLEKVGAQNNAFTSSDLTNYYITIPSNNLEHALYIESDRMLNLNVSQKKPLLSSCLTGVINITSLKIDFIFISTSLQLF